MYIDTYRYFPVMTSSIDHGHRQKLYYTIYALTAAKAIRQLFSIANG